MDEDNNQVYKSIEEKVDAFKRGEKLIMHSRNYYCNIAATKTKKKSLYFQCNKSMDRMYVTLEDGITSDYPLSLLEIINNSFTQYKEPRKVMTIKEIEKELGYKIEIVSEVEEEEI